MYNNVHTVQCMCVQLCTLLNVQRFRLKYKYEKKLINIYSDYQNKIQKYENNF